MNAASNPLLQQFLQESRDALEGIAGSLMALERNPADSALLDDLFRVVHTLKGNCGLFDFPDMFRVIHAAEDLLSAVRDGRLVYDRDMADAVLDAMDFVSLQLDEIGTGATPDAAHGPAAVALAERLCALSGDAAGSGDAGAGADTPSPSAARTARMEAALALAPAELRAGWSEALAAGEALLWIEYTPEAECFFKGEDPLYQAIQLPGVLWQRVVPAEAWPALPELDPYRCNLVFQAVSGAARAEVEEHFRYVPDQVWIDALPAAAAAAPQEDERLADALAIVQAQGQALWSTGDTPWVPGRLLAAVAAIRGCMTAVGRGAILAELDGCLADALARRTVAPVLAWIERHAQGAAHDDVQAAPAALPEAVRAGDATAADSAALADAAPDQKFGRRAEDQGAGRILKVEQSKVDRLMNLIGEMVVARNGLPYLAARAEDHYGVRELAREIKTQHGVINRIVEEMQDAIMQVRMTPVSFVFQRFPRLVRDIARRLGKEVELVLEGEATEADKNVIEALADPLVHIVRNALDHGLETPAARAQAGKPACGRLVIGARQEADRVIIEVSDDGRGIDPSAIRRKAYGKGLIDEGALEGLSDQDSVNLVFLPGFSTAEQVSDLSGRGVGMDAVRSAVDRLGGNVSLSSTAGQGTRMQLSLPLSMAVTNVMVVESGGVQYGVPMDMVVETVRVPAASVHAIKQYRTAVLRGRIVPLRSLNELLALDRPQRHNEHDEMATLVLRVHGQDVGLVIDDFREVVEVILKPMAGILGGLDAYAGSALLGDGSVLMVINPKELLQ
ncbi:chemotaxis protein CheA [Herbaspirillum sp. SJZ107]|uniref:chemotaxis protein CheA n=1 Tax=Herbaspirillum sp. SJZ107 TaxID=2572881 RepID=UPI00114F2205|nr:chemotaxis protein CheA [Herbaspirillum sp. SJZ107]TQK03271.1 two-component system chemotaxis sensor kinase CheA [Herbaspirillum sp. SJZ107]